MIVREWLERLNRELEPYGDFDIDEDWHRSVVSDGYDLIDAIKEAIQDGTDLRIDYNWNYDD